jgi:hypothetical protein
MLTFESKPPSRDLERGAAILRICRSEEDYFRAAQYSREAYDVVLPNAFAETALMDDPSGWRERQRPGRAAEDLGFRMWNQIPEHVRAEVLSGTPDIPRRVSIVSTTTGMDGIPWEWLNGGDDRTLATMPNVRLFRQVPVMYASPPLTVPPPVRVLIVITNPKDERLLDAYRELSVIKSGLDGNGDYEVRELLEPRVEALRSAFEWSPHVMHYVGHAGISGTAGHIILHDFSEGTRWLSAGEMVRLIPASVRLLCLSTCITTKNYQTGGLVRFAHCPPDLALPTTIVNQYALGEVTATTFWRRFYPALIAREGNAVEACHESRVAARAVTDETWSWASFSLVVRDGSGQPFRIARTKERRPDELSAEVQAQWSARLANNLANRKRSLGAEIQGSFDESIRVEQARLERFTKGIGPV